MKITLSILTAIFTFAIIMGIAFAVIAVLLLIQTPTNLNLNYLMLGTGIALLGYTFRAFVTPSKN